MGKFKFLAGAATAAFLSLSGAAQASIIYNGSTTINTHSALAKAEFSIVLGQLIIELSNLSPNAGAGVHVEAEMLNAVSFILPVGITLSAVSATSPGSIFNATTCNANPCGGVNVNVGGEWGYFSTFGLAPGNSIIGAAGFAGGNANFGGLNLHSPPNTLALNGADFGIMSTAWDDGDNVYEATDGVAGAGNITGNPFIKDLARFVLNINGGSLLLSDLSNVQFWYGTNGANNSSGCLPSGQVGICATVPEPGSFSLLLMALLGLGGLAFAGARRARV